LAELRRHKSKLFGKLKKDSEFGRDPVARGSSGLKPLRRRTPNCSWRELAFEVFAWDLEMT